MVKEIKVKAVAKANGFTVLFTSIVVFFVTLLIMLPAGGAVKLFGYFVLSLSIAGILLGSLKLAEPDYSFTIDESGLHYHHSKGGWDVDWKNMQRIDIPTVTHGWDQRELNYVAIRLKSLSDFLDGISLRLASHLLTEQKHLVGLALKEDFEKWQCKDGSCPSGQLYNFDKLKLDGKTYTGFKAMLGHRMILLSEKLGVDVFISNSAIDRSPEQFVNLIRQLKAHQESFHS